VESHEFQALTEQEFEKRIVLVGGTMNQVTRLSLLVDLCWSLLFYFESSPENDSRQDRFCAKCRAVGIDPSVPISICQVGMKVRNGMN